MQFQGRELGYDQLIVQSLVGNLEWSSGGRDGSLYHIDHRRKIKTFWR